MNSFFKSLLIIYVCTAGCFTTFCVNAAVHQDKGANSKRNVKPNPQEGTAIHKTNAIQLNHVEEEKNSRFDKDIATIALEIAKSLKLSPDKPLYMTTITKDRRYMLPLGPLFNQLQTILKKYASKVQFKSPQGSEVATINEIIRSGSSMRIENMPIDSLIMTASYFLLNKRPDQIYYVIKIQDIRAVKLYESEELVLTPDEYSLALGRVTAEKLKNKEFFGETEYKGNVIEKLDQLFNSGDNNLLLPPLEYSFDNRHRYAINYQVNALKEILNLKYGISFKQGLPNRIILNADGTLTFRKDSADWPLDKIVDGEPLFGDEFSRQCSTYIYMSPSTGRADIEKKPEEKKFSTPGEIKVRDEIFKTFNYYYPALFDPFNFEILNKIFVENKGPSILVGIVDSSNPSTGKEIVTYQWKTKQDWLKHLKMLVDISHRTFEVKTSVMKVFHDDLDPNRYWAIVRQNWKTKDSFENTVYQDNGFLFVNFDFTADRVLRDFKIYYRLWFYEYQYDDIELGIKRYQKLENDITTHFKNGIKSVSDTLKDVMCDFLISQIRKNGTRWLKIKNYGKSDF